MYLLTTLIACAIFSIVHIMTCMRLSIAEAYGVLSKFSHFALDFDDCFLDSLKLLAKEVQTSFVSFILNI